MNRFSSVGCWPRMRTNGARGTTRRAYSDEEDEDDDGFAGLQASHRGAGVVGDTVLTGETPDSSRLFGDDDRVISIPLWDLRRTEKFE